MDGEQHVIFIASESREIIISYEDRNIDIEPEIRELEIGPMLQKSAAHGATNTIRWRVDYKNWLDNATELQTLNITSSSATLTIGAIQILGRHAYFFVQGGTVGEQATVTLTATDFFGEKKVDTVQFTVVAP